MIKTFRVLLHFIQSFNMKQNQIKITISFENIHDLYHFQYNFNKEMGWSDLLDAKEGTIYEIPFELRVR